MEEFFLTFFFFLNVTTDGGLHTGGGGGGGGGGNDGGGGGGNDGGGGGTFGVRVGLDVIDDDLVWWLKYWSKFEKLYHRLCSGYIKTWEFQNTEYFVWQESALY